MRNEALLLYVLHGSGLSQYATLNVVCLLSSLVLYLFPHHLCRFFSLIYIYVLHIEKFFCVQSEAVRGSSLQLLINYRELKQLELQRYTIN